MEELLSSGCSVARQSLWPNQYYEFAWFVSAHTASTELQRVPDTINPPISIRATTRTTERHTPRRRRQKSATSTPRWATRQTVTHTQNNFPHTTKTRRTSMDLPPPIPRSTSPSSSPTNPNPHNSIPTEPTASPPNSRYHTSGGYLR